MILTSRYVSHDACVLLGVRTKAEGVRSGVTQRTAAADASLAGLTASWHSESEVQQKALLEQVAAMVARFSADRSSALATAVQGVRKQLVDDSARLAEDVEALGAGAATVTESAEVRRAPLSGNDPV